MQKLLPFEAQSKIRAFPVTVKPVMHLLRTVLVLAVLLTSPVGTAADDPETANTITASSAVAITPTATAPNIDPWEPLNRKLFAFNEFLDDLVLRPVAVGYRFIMPDFAERGVSNVIDNVYQLNSVFNSLLQGELEGAARSGSRFVVNSTLGLVGLFDVATPMGIDYHRADFGQTLAVWGFDSGPYVMVPLLGPRTVRSGVGYLFDTYTSIPAYLDNREAAWTFWIVEVVDYRASLLDTEDLITGDRYIFLRDAYIQSRESFVKGGLVEDSFSDFEESDDWEEF